MEYQKNMLFVFRMATLICIILCFGTSSTRTDLQQTIEQQLNKEHLHQTNEETHLSRHDNYEHLRRKRRYLEFPEGSSFQLVYDLIIGVVDFTNYLILGVTVALAWELPSKPPSEILNDLSERLKDGTLGTSRNDTVDKIKYLDFSQEGTTIQNPFVKYKFNLKPMLRPPMHYQYHTPETEYDHLIKSNHYYMQSSRKKAHPFIKWTKKNKYPKMSVKGIKYPWWNLPERLKNSFERPSIRRFDKNTNFNKAVYPYKYKLAQGNQSKFQGTGRSEHRIYPVFGKRSISANQTASKNLTSTRTRYKRSGIATKLPSKYDHIHIEYHRRSRHDLYQRIESYLNSRGSHGHHCVLRALCETGQKSNELKPGSFVGELMRAIFTIPEPSDATLGGKRYVSDNVLRYDAANALKQDCSRRYAHCKESLWSSHFVL